jgi:beta-galactosidase
VTRRSFNTLTAGIIAGTGFSPTLQSAAANGGNVASFPYGTHVYREPSLPLDQLRADFPVLKKLGFSMIKIQESWSADENKEGEIDLSKVARVVSDARQNNLLVYFGVTMEQAPAWLWRKYPDATMLLDTGQPYLDPTQYLLPNDGKPGPCWNHQGARQAAIRFIEAVGREIGHYDNILVWNVWQEINFTFDANASRFCFCPNTLAAFRVWLKTKYASLDGLNETWRSHYAAWDEVEPPRVFLKVPSMIDWRYFMENVYLSEALRWKAEAFRRSDPNGRKILAHAPSPRYGSAEDWCFARAGLDVYGSSCYPAWSEFQNPGISDEERVKHSPAPYRQLVDNAIKWDYTRSASVNGEFWTAELQGGRAGGGITPGRVPDPGDIRRWVLGALAGGARGVCFWNHRSEIFWDEAYGFGLLELKGDSTARAAEAGRIGAAVNSKAAELLGRGACPPAKTGILLDESTWNFVHASGEPLLSGFVANLRGIHQGLWQEAIPVDFLNSTELDTRGQQYQALILPLPISMSKDLIGKVCRYVQNGGTLISGPFPGRFSEYGFGVAGELPPEMTALFGVEHKQILTISERPAHSSQSSFRSEDLKPLKLSGVKQFAGIGVDPSFYLQYMTPTKAAPILQLGAEVVGAHNRFGKGQTYLIGTLFGAPIGNDQPANQHFLAAVLKNSGIQPDRAGRLWRRRREHAGKAAWFLFNPTRETVEENVALERFTKAEDLLGSELKITNGSVRINVGPLDICCLLLS